LNHLRDLYVAGYRKRFTDVNKCRSIEINSLSLLAMSLSNTDAQSYVKAAHLWDILHMFMYLRTLQHHTLYIAVTALESFTGVILDKLQYLFYY
jgi:hypothetical protein